MSGYERAQLATLLARLDEAPRRLVVVTGPRQAGKTTLVRQALDRIDRPSRYLSADEPDPAGARDSRWLVREWEAARAAADASDRGFVLALDEIQNIRGWSEAVKGLWDADRWRGRRLRVVLLGSSPMRVREGMGESLAGRFETVRLAQWSFGEMAAAFGFDLARYVYFGGYPGAAPLAGDEERWRAYVREALVAPAIERDVLAARRVEKPALMKRLFELGAEYSGQILSYNKMLGQLQDSGNAATLARYLDLLADTGMIAGLPKFALAGHRRRAASPKLVVLDTGLASALSGYGFAEARADRAFWGRLVESAVGAHLFNTGAPEVRLHYWRENGREVDFVLRCGRKTVAVEVKSGPRRRGAGALAEFARRFKAGRSILVGEGGVPLSEFLSTPARAWLAPDRDARRAPGAGGASGPAGC